MKSRLDHRLLVAVAALAGSGGCNALLGVHDLAATADAQDPNDASPIDQGPGSNDALDGDQRPVPLHLAPADGLPGSMEWLIESSITIDTSSLMATIALPAGVTLDARPQVGGGPELAVLHVGSLRVDAPASVVVRGARPLVIVAAGAIDISGTLDASAHLATPGGGAATTGAGFGGAGVAGTGGADSGGGGGGFGTDGARGGLNSACNIPAGAPGVATGDATIAVLVGGAGGGIGLGSTCPMDAGGAGGGALQLSAAAITVAASGRILAGGGGGTGGTDCATSDSNSGGGGGAGGAIVLQASTISNAGVIAANGGGGGGSTSVGSGNASPGQDGLPSDQAALGGTGSRATGGKGGALALAPVHGGDAGCAQNAAGGGGAVGRIAASASYTASGITSPVPDLSLPP